MEEETGNRVFGSGAKLGNSRIFFSVELSFFRREAMFPDYRIKRTLWILENKSTAGTVSVLRSNSPAKSFHFYRNEDRLLGRLKILPNGKRSTKSHFPYRLEPCNSRVCFLANSFFFSPFPPSKGVLVPARSRYFLIRFNF